MKQTTTDTEIKFTEPFDYTKWQQNLFASRSIEVISAAAMTLRREKESEADSGANP